MTLNFAFISFVDNKIISYFNKGPPRLPFFGAYLFILLINYKHIQIGVDWLCKYYKTNILGLYIGPFLSVIANDSASIKELMLDTKLDGRPDLFLVQLRDPNNVTRGVFRVVYFTAIS